MVRNESQQQIRKPICWLSLCLFVDGAMRDGRTLSIQRVEITVHGYEHEASMHGVVHVEAKRTVRAQELVPYLIRTEYASVTPYIHTEVLH